MRNAIVLLFLLGLLMPQTGALSIEVGENQLNYKTENGLTVSTNPAQQIHYGDNIEACYILNYSSFLPQKTAAITKSSFEFNKAKSINSVNTYPITNTELVNKTWETQIDVCEEVCTELNETITECEDAGEFVEVCTNTTQTYTDCSNNCTLKNITDSKNVWNFTYSAKGGIDSTKQNSYLYCVDIPPVKDKDGNVLLAKDNFNITAGLSKADPNIDNCQTLAGADTTYTLTQDTAVNSSTCMTVTAENIVLDCAGYTITGDNTSSTYGVYSTKYNTTVKNCNIDNFHFGIYYVGVDNGLIQNNTVNFTSAAGRGIVTLTSITNLTSLGNTVDMSGASGTSYGFSINDASAENVTIDCQGTNIYGSNDGDYGISVLAPNVMVTNCNVIGASVGLYFSSYENGTLQNSSAVNGSQIGIRILNKNNMTIINNSISNFTEKFYNGMYLQKTNNSLFANNSFDKVYRGIDFRGSNNNTFANNTITNTNSTGIYLYDYGSIYSDNNNFTNNTITTAGTGADGIYVLYGQNNTIDCLGAVITGDNSSGSYGVYSKQYNTTVKNCIIQNFSTGIYIDGDSADYANITNNTITLTYSTSCSFSTGACNAIILKSADNSTISNNTISAYQYGINLYSSANNNTIQYNNVTTSSTYAIHLHTNSNYNLIQYNNATASSRTIFLRSNSDNNTIQYNNASGSTQAIYLHTNSNNTVKYNNASVSANTAIYLVSSSNNNISNNNATAENDYAIYIVSTDNDNNTFTNNTLKAGSSVNARTVIYIDDVTSDNNTFYYNNITGAIWVNNVNETNYFNTTNAGNIYYFSNGTPSWEVYDITTSNPPNWATSGSDRPFSNTTIGEWSGFGNDSHPWTETAITPTLNSIVITPAAPANNATIGCTINISDIDNTTLEVNASFYRNNVKLFNFTNNSYTNNTDWIINLTLNQSISIQGDNWSCAARAFDGLNTLNDSFSSNITTTVEAAKITTIAVSRFNGTATKTGGNTFAGIIDSFQLTTPFSVDTEFDISSILYASMTTTKTVEYDIFDNTNIVELGSTSRTMDAGLDGAISIQGGEHVIPGSATQNYLTRQRQTVGGDNTLFGNNQTTLFEGMRDLATGLEINHSRFNLSGTTSSTSFVLLDSVLWTPTDRGFIYMDAMDVELNNSDSYAEYIISLNGFNSTTMKRNVSSIGSSGVFVLNPTVYDPTEGAINISLYGRTDGGIITFSLKNAVPKIVQTNEIGSVDLTGESFTSSDFTQIKNLTITTLTNGRDIIVKAAISINATVAATNVGVRIRLVNSTGETEAESLYLFRDLPTANNAGNIIIHDVFINRTLGDYTSVLEGLSSNANNVDVVGGVLIMEVASNIPTTAFNLSCGEIHASGTEFLLQGDLTTTGTCFNITVVDVIIDCQGFSVTGDNSSGSFGVWTQAVNSTIQNCTLHSFEAGIGTNSTNLLAYRNNLTTTFWINNSGSSNFFNTTDAGNIYYFINGTAAWDVYNITTNLPAPNWANNGSNYPFDSSLDEWIGTSNDSAPWTTVQGNTFPVLNTILFLPASPLATDTLQCSVNASNGESSQLNITFEFYKNGTNQTALAGSVNITNNTLTNIANVSDALTDIGQNWSCRARANDGVDFTDWVFSDNITIGDKWVAGILFYPYNETVFGPGQCSVLGQLNLTSSNSTDNKNTSCNLYSYSGAPGEDYTLVGTDTQITPDGIQNFSFTLIPSQNQSFRMNCSITFDAINEITNTQNFSIIGQSLCGTPPTGNETSETTKEFIYTDLSDDINNIFGVFFIIMGMYGLLRSVIIR